jgi:hypothetical protein
MERAATRRRTGAQQQRNNAPIKMYPFLKDINTFRLVFIFISLL